MRISLLACSLLALIPGTTGAAAYHVIKKVTVTNSSATLTRLTVIMPLAQTCQYQTVANVSVNTGTVLEVPRTEPADRYVRWSITSGLPGPGQQKEFSCEFDVMLLPYNFDFSGLSAVNPYDSASNLFQWYTAVSGSYVDPQNAVIRRVGDSLWVRSSDIVDYARRCYDYVAWAYGYLNPNTGLHTLADILSAGGGDCGNLSSIWVSLLRYRKIPARHVVTVRPNATFHVWSEFYLEGYGWIPVDVTAEQSNPAGDYFGRYDGNGIVMNHGVYLELALGNGSTYYAPLLQTYGWWYWGSGSGIQSGYSITSSVIPDMAVQVAEGDVPDSYDLLPNFPNPFNPSTAIRIRVPRLSSQSVELKVYDLAGRVVSVLHNGKLSPGLHTFAWTSQSAASGMYIADLTAGKFRKRIVMTLMR